LSNPEEEESPEKMVSIEAGIEVKYDTDLMIFQKMSEIDK